MDMVMMQIQDENERDMAMARAFGNTCGYCDGLMHETADCGYPDRYWATGGCGYCLADDHLQFDDDNASKMILCGKYAAWVRAAVEVGEDKAQALLDHRQREADQAAVTAYLDAYHSADTEQEAQTAHLWRW